ncbi:MAG: GC-type dockerin domain-anchored protein [Phycisphaerales bacterium JB060]
MDHRTALIACFLAPQACLAQYAVHELLLPPGADQSVVTAIGDDGRIVGSARLDSFQVAVTWATYDAEPQILGTLDGGHISEAVALTGGLVVGVSGRDCGRPGAFQWTSASGMSAIGPNGCSTLHPVDISSSGEVLLQIGEPQFPLVWSLGLGAPRMLETWGQPATVVSIDASGRVLGSSAHHPDGGGIVRAVQWDASGEGSLLDRLDPDASGIDEAAERNDAGVIVGRARLGSVTRAAVWEDASSEPIDAGEALGPTVRSHLLAINQAGQAVGGSALGAILWTRAGGAVELATMVDQTGDGWELHSAQDINDAGIIVGNGANPGGRPGAFALVEGGGACPADLDADGELTIFDFLAFQNLFDSGDPQADFDGDGELTLFDFLAFQNAFDAGC